MTVAHQLQAASPAAPGNPAAPRADGVTAASVQVATSVEELRRYEADWETLAAVAAEPNVFLEPWHFLPAVEAFGAGKRSLFLFVYATMPGPQPKPELIGFFPFECTRGLRGIPARVLTAWRHEYSSLSTPLVHRDHAHQAWSALIAWAAARPQGASLIEFPSLLAEGPSYRALVDTIHAGHLISATIEHHTRAQLERLPDPRSPHPEGLSSGARKELRRQRRRLAESGRLDLRKLGPSEDPQPWIDQFRALEASGWKGKDGTAFSCRAESDRYFQTICRNGFGRGRLQMLGLFLDARPIAMKCNFASGRVGYTLKIAFDEAYSAYSPGVLLELDGIDHFLQQDALDRLDSCAIPDHPMINRLWPGRREIVDLVFSPGGSRGNLQIGAYALLRSLKRSIRNPQHEKV